jgi:hypothetical protein
VDPEISIRGPVLFKEQKNRISKQFAIRKIKKYRGKIQSEN